MFNEARQIDLEDQDTIDPREWDMANLFSALGLNQDQQDELTRVWQQVAPNSDITEFTRALVMGGSSRLALQMQEPA